MGISHGSVHDHLGFVALQIEVQHVIGLVHLEGLDGTVTGNGSDGFPLAVISVDGELGNNGATLANLNGTGIEVDGDLLASLNGYAILVIAATAVSDFAVEVYELGLPPVEPTGVNATFHLHGRKNLGGQTDSRAVVGNGSDHLAAFSHELHRIIGVEVPGIGTPGVTDTVNLGGLDFQNLVNEVDVHSVETFGRYEAVAVGHGVTFVGTQAGEVTVPLTQGAELEAVGGEVTGAPEGAFLTPYGNEFGNAVAGPIPVTEIGTNHVHGGRSLGLAFLLDLVGEAVGDVAGSQLEGEGDLVSTCALGNGDVVSAGLAVLTQVGVGLHGAFLIQGDLPCAVVGELELTAVGQLLAAEGEGDAFVLGLGSLQGGEAPAVHATADTHGNRAEENLGVGQILVGVQVQNNVIQTGLGNLHLRSSVTHDKLTLEHLVGGVAVIDAGELGGLELGQRGAVGFLLATVHISKGEVLTAFQNDVLLVHAVAKGLVIGLVDTLGHGEDLRHIGLASGLADYIEAVFGDVVHIRLVFFVILFAGYCTKCQNGDADERKNFFHCVVCN